MEKSLIIPGLIIFILFGSIYLLFLNKAINAPFHIEQTDCYDKYSNKIINATCEKTVYDSPMFNGINGLLFGITGLLFFIGSLLGFLIFLVGLIINFHS